MTQDAAYHPAGAPTGASARRAPAPVEAAAPAGDSGRMRRVVVASSLGAVFEAYDLVLYGPMAAIIARTFFSGLDEAYAYVFALLSAAVSYLARPFGGLIFGRLGDLAGRKYAFLLTIVVMGGSTVLIGLLPCYAAVGIASPILLMSLRFVQGLAFGGEFGGAVTYIAEHASARNRGLATSAVGITMACGLILAILVVLACETLLGKAAFEAWGWRIPFLLSAVLMLVSVYMRLRLQESPLFLRMRSGGGLAKRPVREALGQWRYLRTGLLVLFGAVAGQSVATATGAYPIYLLMLNLKIDPFLLHYTILGYSTGLVACLIAAGWLSDRVGRKPVMLAGFIGTALVALPVFQAVTHRAHPALETAMAAHPVVVAADPAGCSRQFDPLGLAPFRTPCDVARRAVAKLGIPYETRAVEAGAPAQVLVGAAAVAAFDGRGMDKAAFDAGNAAFGRSLAAALSEAGYPARADPARTDVPALIGLLVLLNAFVALASAPLAAWMIELVPTRIRSTVLSLAYNLGGLFGGFFPAIAFSAFTATGSLYAGLWYATAVLAVSAAVAALFLPETRGRPLDAVA
ncbi:MFS transporter [Methylobacterium sp. NEAU 140]|uniref:MFS transporter n=1 Tax=Methylobacterium sp. NEAU 140 TaxID=3064945 RepID=UPI0027368CB4|nr:MFS transporter [Methylobacterium sp. NEAU 140]MDP4021605.1 MFS transporter [Methylobacterium sp. NEAU 140]